MGITESISMFIIMLTLALIPSASVVLVVTRSVTHDMTNGVAVSIGIVVGDLVFIALAILGLSVVAETMGWLFLTIKYIGATYLIWLGYKLLTSKPTSTITVETRNNQTNKKGNLATSFLAGLFLTLGDIKAIFFYVSLLPTFVNLAALHFADVVVIMLVTIVTVGGVKIFYAFSANRIVAMSHGYSSGYSLESKAKKVAGSFMIGAGSYLIIKS